MMAYSLMHLNPEGASEIAKVVEKPLGVADFLKDLSVFLNSVGSSVASQDLAFCTAAELNGAGIFEKLPVAELSRALSPEKSVPVVAFTLGLPSRIRTQIAAFRKAQLEAQKPPSATTTSSDVSYTGQRRAKKVAGRIKLQVKAGSANPSPPIGPALGLRGIDIIEFCKAFNAATQELQKGMPIPVVITYYEDKSFTFVMMQPPLSYFLKKEAKTLSGSQYRGGGGKARSISKAKIKSIAEAKMKELHQSTLEGAIRVITQEASTLGIKIVS